MRVMPGATLVVLLLVACGAAWAQSGCWTVNGNTLLTDTDGTGSATWPSTTCFHTFDCQNDETIRLDTISGAKVGSEPPASFVLSCLAVLDGQVLGPVAQFNTQFTAFRWFYWSSIRMGFQPSGTAPGGAEVTYSCHKNCPWALTSSTTSSNEGSITSGQFNSGSSPAACRTVVSAATCQSWENVAYRYEKRPEHTNNGEVHPGWLFFFVPTISSSLPVGRFPETHATLEVFWVPQSINMEVRAPSNKNNMEVQVDYDCTPVYVCGQVDAAKRYLPGTTLTYWKGAILSDLDGMGVTPFPNTPQDCTWDIQCPYDSNVFQPLLGGFLNKDNVDSITLTPRLGNPQTFTTEVVNRSQVQWGSPTLQVHWKTTTNPGNRDGFTYKYICAFQCSAAPDSRYVSGAEIVLYRAWAVVANKWSDMCRWVVDTQCTPQQTGIIVNVVEKPSTSGVTTWKLILDWYDRQFDIVYPDTVQGDLLYFPAGQFNASVRAFGGYSLAYNITTRCAFLSRCDLGLTQTPLPVSATQNLNGHLVSDADGVGPRPYSATDKTCEWHLQCAGTLYVSVTGVLAAGDELAIYDGPATSDTKLHSYTGTFTFNNVQLPSNKDLLIDFVVTAATPSNGFTLTYTCTPGAQETTASPGGVIVTPAPDGSPTTTTPPTTAEPPSPQSTTASPSASGVVGTTAPGGPTPPTKTKTVQLPPSSTTTVPGSSNSASPSESPNSNGNITTNQPITASPSNVPCFISTAGCDLANTDRAEALPNGTCVCVCKNQYEGVLCDYCPPRFDNAAGAECDRCWNATLAYPLCLVPLGAAPAEEDGPPIGAIVGGVIGGIIFLLLLLILIVLLLKKKGLAFRDLDVPFFNDATKYTKGFEYRTDLSEEANQRSLNDENADNSLANMLAAKPYDPTAHQEMTPAPAAKPPVKAPPTKKVMDFEDI